jgi:hypothetical protein
MTENSTRSKLGSIAMTLLITTSVLAAGLALVAGPAAASGDVTVQVDDVDGDGLEGVDVVVRDASDDSAAANGTTDANGTFTASGVSDGDYYADVSDPGYVDVPETSNVSITASNAQIDVELISADEQVNTTVSVGNDTASAYGDVTGADDLSSLQGNESRAGFHVVGLNHSSDGNTTETTLSNSTAAVTAGNTTSFEYILTDDDHSTYDEVRVVVEGNGNHSSSVDGGTLEATRGGGGSAGGLEGLLSATFMGIPLVAILLGVGVAAFVYKSQDDRGF